MAQCTTDRDRQVDPCQRCQPNPDPARSSARRQYQQTVQKLMVSAQRNDQSKEVIRHVMHHASCVALARTPPPPRASNVLPPFPFLFSSPTAPFSRKYHENTDIFKPRWSNLRGHREVVLNQLVGPIRPRSWPQKPGSHFSRPESPPGFRPAYILFATS